MAISFAIRGVRGARWDHCRNGTNRCEAPIIFSIMFSIIFSMKPISSSMKPISFSIKSIICSMKSMIPGVFCTESGVFWRRAAASIAVPDPWSKAPGHCFFYKQMKIFQQKMKVLRLKMKILLLTSDDFVWQLMLAKIKKRLHSMVMPPFKPGDVSETHRTITRNALAALAWGFEFLNFWIFEIFKSLNL